MSCHKYNGKLFHTRLLSSCCFRFFFTLLSHSGLGFVPPTVCFPNRFDKSEPLVLHIVVKVKVKVKRFIHHLQCIAGFNIQLDIIGHFGDDFTRHMTQPTIIALKDDG